MARSSAKKTIINNSKIMKKTVCMMIISSALFLLQCMIYNNIRTFIVKSVPELLMFFYIFKISRPKYTTGKLSSGYDLSSRGLISLCFYFLYLSIFIKFVAFWSSFAYFLYFILFISAIYEFYWRFRINKM